MLKKKIETIWISQIFISNNFDHRERLRLNMARDLFEDSDGSSAKIALL